MTREEAKRFGHCILAIDDTDIDKDIIEFTKIALEALEQEPCDDAVSRKAVLEIFGDVHPLDYHTIGYVSNVQRLPSVNPQKIGYWIPQNNYDDWGYECSYKCSECGDLDTYPSNFCHNCGAKMEERKQNEFEVLGG